MPVLKLVEFYDYLFIKMLDFELLVEYILGPGTFAKFYPSEKYALMLLTNFFFYVMAAFLGFLGFKLFALIMRKL